MTDYMIVMVYGAAIVAGLMALWRDRKDGVEDTPSRSILDAVEVRQ